MHNKKILIQVLALGPVVLIPAMVLLVSMLVFQTEKEAYEASLLQAKHDFLETEKSRIRSKVNNMVDLVAYRQSIINQKLHTRIQRRVEDAHGIAMALHKHYYETKSEDELKELIIESLRPLVWNAGESFIWILDLKGNFQLAPNYLRHLEGQSIIDFEDATGRKVIQEEIAITKNQGQGFLWDTFTKPNEPIDKQFKQLAYVKDFGIYDWYLGSGEYLDTATKLTNSYLLQAISQVGKGETDYFFVLDENGTMLLNYARPDVVGKNVSTASESSLKTLFNQAFNARKDDSGKFIEYEWLNPVSGEVETKMTFIKVVPGSKWVIGSGFYPTSLEGPFNILKERVDSQYELKKQDINGLTWIGVMAALFIGIIMALFFHRILSRYQLGLVEANNELTQLNINLENKVIETKQELEKLNGELQGVVTTDSLTQIANRFALFNYLREEVHRAERFNQAFSIVLFDIDCFKNINEKFGHEAGDKVLQQLTRLVYNQVRSVDVVGRFGGGEFLILMPNANVNTASENAEKIRKLIEENVFEDEMKVTVSLGVAEYRKNYKVADILKASSTALYSAKDQGRNRVCQFNDE